MFSADADLFFSPVDTRPSFPNWFGVLYLLRRDINQCMGIASDPTSKVCGSALWPGAMAILAGVDLLGKFLSGDDASREVGNRFRCFLETCLAGTNPEERDVLYQLRNALLHSFGLYSESKGKVFRFFLINEGTGALISFVAPEAYRVDLRLLHVHFETAIETYRLKLEAETDLQRKFAAMFLKYGRVCIGKLPASRQQN